MGLHRSAHVGTASHLPLDHCLRSCVCRGLPCLDGEVRRPPLLAPWANAFRSTH
jgi:hypothetical protein